MEIWIVMACCLVGCYASACNSSLKSFSRKRLADILEARGQADRLEPFIERLPKLVLITGTVRSLMSLLVLLAVLYFVQKRFQNLVYLYAFLGAATLVSIFIVAIPVSWARYHRGPLLAWSIPVFSALLSVLLPIASFLQLFDPLVRRILGAESAEPNDHELTDELLSVVEDHEGPEQVDQAQKDMLEAVIELPATSAGEVMTPRTEVKGIEIDRPLQDVKHTILEDGHSRIPVYEQSLDHIVGILYAKDLIPFVGNGGAFELRSVLREAFMVPESKSVRELLAEFKARKVHMAIVLDEYGGTAGLVTIEDILEEIVGEIQDEYEGAEQPPRIDVIDTHTAEVDARIHIDEVNQALDLALPEDEDFDTVGGFVFSQLGHIPEIGESFEFGDVCVTITDAERTKVNRIKIHRLEPLAKDNSTNGH